MKQRFTQWAIFLAVVLPVFFMAAFSLLKTYHDLTDAVMARRQTIAQLAAMTLKEKLDRTKDLAVSLATRVRFSRLIGEGRWDEAVRILRQVPDDFPFIDRIFITDPSGTLMADIPAVAAVRGQRFAFRDWYRGVSARWEPYISEVYKRTAEPRHNVIAVAAPIRAGDGLVLGAMVLQIRTDTLFAWSRGIEAEESAFIYVVDHHGQLAAHPEYTIQGAILNVSTTPIGQRLLREQRGVETSLDPIGGHTMLAAYAPVAGHGWGVVAQQPATAAFAVRNDTVRRLAGVYSVILIVNCLLAVVILRTIAAQRRANATALDLNAQLQAANQELGAFSYSVSHDLRAPLRAIAGFGQALREDCADRLDAAGLDHLQRIHNACGRMAQLIDDLLNLSRLSRTGMTRRPTDLGVLAQAVASELQQAEPGRVAEFSIQPGLTVDGDARLLRIALENLLGNAWKYTQRRDQARIEFGAADRNGTRAYFVRDNGAGFDMAYAGKLFGVFQRLHHASEFPGTGIGLATVQRIIQRHGGKIWAEAKVNEGATFYFTISSEGK